MGVAHEIHGELIREQLPGFILASAGIDGLASREEGPGKVSRHIREARELGFAPKKRVGRR